MGNSQAPTPLPRSVMMPSIRCLPLVLAAALCAAGAHAQEVYRIVGPDGRITFSDRVPAGPGVRATVINHVASSPGPIVMLPPITSIGSWASLSNDARRGLVPAVPLGMTAASPGVVTVELVDALTGVLARAEIVQTLHDQCMRNRPATGGTYEAAARRWQERNGAAVDRANVVLLSAFDPPRRAKLQADAHTRLLGILAPLGSATVDAKSLWCDQSSEAIMQGALDVDGPKGVAQPLKDFAVR